MRPSIPAPGASPEDAGHAGRISSSQLEYELELARRVQRSLFPSQLPTIRGARLAAVNQPARIVSGDLYDVIVIDPERVAILCADVSGKGFPAALMASELHAYVRATLRAACVFADTSLGPLPVQVMTLVNHELSRHYGSGRYATMFFAEYDTGDGMLRYVNAGQNAPLLMVPGRPVVQLADGGPPVGLFEDAAYDVGTVTVPETGSVLIYTDGVVEALNPAGEEFGLPRLTELFGTMLGNADGLLEAVMEALRSWSGAREQGDDITLLALSAGETPNSQSAG